MTLSRTIAAGPEPWRVVDPNDLLINYFAHLPPARWGLILGAVGKAIYSVLADPREPGLPIGDWSRIEGEIYALRLLRGRLYVRYQVDGDDRAIRVLRCQRAAIEPWTRTTNPGMT